MRNPRLARACALVLFAGLALAVLAPSAQAEEPSQHPDEFQQREYYLPFSGMQRSVPNTDTTNRRRETVFNANDGGRSTRDLGAQIIKSLLEEAGVGGLGPLVDAINFFGGAPLVFSPGLQYKYGGFLETEVDGVTRIDRANFPVDVTVKFPETNYFSRGNRILLEPSWTPDTQQQSFSVTPAYYNTTIGAVLRDVSFGITFGVCTPEGPCVLGVCFPPAICKTGTIKIFPEIVGASIPDLELPLITICDSAFGAMDGDTSAITNCGPYFATGFDSLGIPLPFIIPAGKFTISQGAERLCVTTTGGFSLFKLRSKESRKKLCKDPPLPEINACFRPGTPSDLRRVTVPGTQPFRMSLSGRKDEVVKVDLDLFSLLDYAVYAKTGQSCIGTRIVLPGFTLDAGDVSPTYYVDQVTNYNLDSVPRINLDLGEAMTYQIVFADGSLDTQRAGRFVSLTADQKVWVTYPDKVDPVDVMPTFTLDSNFDVLSQHLDSMSTEFRLFQLEMGGWRPDPLLEYKAPKLPIGPPTIVQNSANTNVNDMFPPLDGPYVPIRLDPEDPIVTIDQELSAVQNEGGGSRVITYTYRIANEGDVDLFHVQVVDDLRTTFVGTQQFQFLSAESCFGSDGGVQLEINPLYDGDNDTNIFTDEVGTPDGGEVLRVGEHTYVAVKVRVWPGRPPASVGTGPWTFTHETSASAVSKVRQCYIPNGTLVQAVDQTEVNLGPAQLTDIRQYGLYANKRLELDQVTDSFGHIGCNGDVFIQLGDNGTLAGDIHASKAIAVDGVLEADFAFAPVIDIRATGRLDMTGYLLDGVPREVRPIPTDGALFPERALRVLVPAGRTLDLVSGKYGTITIEKGAMLRIGPGTYDVEHLIAKTGCAVMLDPGGEPIRFNVHRTLRVEPGTEMVMTPFPSVTKDITWVFLDPDADLRVERGARTLGTFFIPAGKAAIESGGHVTGAIYADEIRVDRGASFEFHDESCEQPLYLLFDQDCDGYPDCIDTDPTDPTVPGKRPVPPPSPLHRLTESDAYVSPGGSPFAPGWYWVPSEGRSAGRVEGRAVPAATGAAR